MKIVGGSKNRRQTDSSVCVCVVMACPTAPLVSLKLLFLSAHTHIYTQNCSRKSHFLYILFVQYPKKSRSSLSLLLTTYSSLRVFLHGKTEKREREREGKIEIFLSNKIQTFSLYSYLGQKLDSSLSSTMPTTSSFLLLLVTSLVPIHPYTFTCVCVCVYALQSHFSLLLQWQQQTKQKEKQK